MATIDDNRRLAVLVKNDPNKSLHLTFANRERRMVFFACEKAPLWTMQTYGLPARYRGSRSSRLLFIGFLGNQTCDWNFKGWEP